VLRVRGRSMAPALADGDYVLLTRYGQLRGPRTGDVVCIARPGELVMIKRLGEQSKDGRFQLSGDAAASMPSIDLGLVAAHEIIGRAVLRISGNAIQWIQTKPTR